MLLASSNFSWRCLPGSEILRVYFSVYCTPVAPSACSKMDMWCNVCHWITGRLTAQRQAVLAVCRILHILCALANSTHETTQPLHTVALHSCSAGLQIIMRRHQKRSIHIPIHICMAIGTRHQDDKQCCFACSLPTCVVAEVTNMYMLVCSKTQRCATCICRSSSSHL